MARAGYRQGNTRVPTGHGASGSPSPSPLDLPHSYAAPLSPEMSHALCQSQETCPRLAYQLITFAFTICYESHWIDEPPQERGIGGAFSPTAGTGGHGSPPRRFRVWPHIVASSAGAVLSLVPLTTLLGLRSHRSRRRFRIPLRARSRLTGPARSILRHPRRARCGARSPITSPRSQVRSPGNRGETGACRKYGVLRRYPRCAPRSTVGPPDTSPPSSETWNSGSR